MDPKKIITPEQLYRADIIVRSGFGDYNYKYASNLAKSCRRHKPPINFMSDILKMSPTDIQNIKGVGPVTYDTFIQFLVRYPHLVCIPGFTCNSELKNLVLSKVDTVNAFVTVSQEHQSDIEINTNPTPISEELKFFSVFIEFHRGFSIYIVKAASKDDAESMVRKKFGDRIYRILFNEIDIMRKDFIGIFDDEEAIFHKEE